MSNQKTIQYTHQRLARTPKSWSEKLRLRLEHRAARQQFMREMHLKPAPIETLFPQIPRTRIVIETTARTKESFGNVMPFELITLSSVCAHCKPKRLFEFGTYNGLTTLHLAINSPTDAQIYTIDLAPDDPLRQVTTDETFYTQEMIVGERFHGSPESVKITQIYGDTTKYDHRKLAGQINFIFVDAGHAYELIKSDTEKALEMLAPGGVIFWHDYAYEHVGVYSWLNELSTRLPVFYVPETMLACYIKPM